MKRSKWKFQYKVQDLLEAATKKKDFYQGRLDFWSKAKDETVKKIKDSGIVFDESLANAPDQPYHNSGRQSSVYIDSTLRDDLSESERKILEHKDNVAIYEAWIEILSSQPPKNIYNLNHDDWLFFFSEKVTGQARLNLGLKGM